MEIHLMMTLRNYPESVKIARALLDPPIDDSDGVREYARGIVELLADLFSEEIPTDYGYIEELKRVVAVDLDLDPMVVA